MKVTLPDNYKEMSAEEKLKFFEDYEYEDKSEDLAKVNNELERYKNAVTKANAEAKKYKDERNALMGEEEKKKQATDEAFEAMRQELESLRKDKTVSEYKAQFLGLGYQSSLAEESANALANGEYAKFFQNHKSFLEEAIKSAEANALTKQPSLSSGIPPSQEDIKKNEIAAIVKAAVGN